MQAQSYMSAGQLVPDQVILPMVEERLARSDCRRGFILDGFPRTIPQAELLDEFLNSKKRMLDGALLIDLPYEICVARLSDRRTCPRCGLVYNSLTHPPKKENVCDRCSVPLILREDDQPGTVRKRLEVYRRQTEPLIQYYESTQRLMRVDGSQKPDMVSKNLENMIQYKV